MISSTAPVATDGGAPASGGAPNRADEASTPFDDVLALETLGVTGSMLEGTELGLMDDTDDTGSDEAAEWGALEFLTNLLGIVNMPAPVNAAADASVDAGIAAAGADAGAAQQALLTGDALAQAARAQLALAPSDAASSTSQADAEAISSADAAQNDARAAELLAGSARSPGVGAAERAGITTSVRDPRWTEHFGTRIALMVRAGESSASLQLSPVDLGPLDVSITVRDSQANIHFGAAHPDTRALIEASIPRLRELLAAQGFSLMDASVSQGFARQPRAAAAASAQASGHEAEAEVRSAPVIVGTGLLDLYA